MFIFSKNGSLLSTIMQNVRQKNASVSNDGCLSGRIRTGRLKKRFVGHYNYIADRLWNVVAFIQRSLAPDHDVTLSNRK